MRGRVLALAAVAALAAAPTGKPNAPGSYCPLPEGDAPPVCLDPAQAEYSPFFQKLAEGEVDRAAAGKVESDLRGDRRYEALSSLAYAYYVTSRRAAARPDLDPEAAARLARWTELLGDTFEASESDPHFQAALREAASDLERRAPALPLRCTDPDGSVRECSSTSELVASMNETRDHSGLRGRLARLLERWFGSGPP